MNTATIRIKACMFVSCNDLKKMCMLFKCSSMKPKPFIIGFFCSPNAVLRLRFNHFATECSWDHMYIYDGDSVYAPLVAVFR